MRNFEGGPIPWDAVLEYGCYISLNRAMLDDLVIVIRSMDLEYIKWSVAEADKKSKQRMKSAKTNKGSKH